MEHQEFPQYRRMKGGRNLYCITAPDHFVELQGVGSGWLRQEVNAVAYPEKVRIAEMLAFSEGAYEPLEPDAFAAIERFAK